MANFKRWKEVKPIVLHAYRLSEDDRQRYLDGACGSDAELREIAVSLLGIPRGLDRLLDDLTTPPPPAFDPLPINSTLSGYQIEHLIRSGRMGAVYLANDPRNKRKVAIKVLPPSIAERYPGEQEKLGRLRHENIAVLFGSGTTPDGYAYFAMEYVEGPNIIAYCAAEHPTIQDRLRLFRQACSAVAFAHRKEIVHCDLKPDNILVTRDELTNAPIVKLLDFGIARLLSDEALTALTTRAGDEYTRALSLPYASPEQLDQRRPDTLSDVYSLGVLLCVLLTDLLPYPDSSKEELASAIRNAAPVPPSELVKLEQLPSDGEFHDHSLIRTVPSPSWRIWGDLDAIVLRALAKAPEERYASVKELSDDIGNHLARRPVAARNGNLKYHLYKIIDRHRPGAAFAVISLLGAIAFSAALGHQYHLTLRERDAARVAAVRSNQLSTFLVSMFDLGDPFRHLTTPPTLGELLAQSVRQLRSGRFNMPADKTL
jgi:serine/threonine protein kinase